MRSFHLFPRKSYFSKPKSKTSLHHVRLGVFAALALIGSFAMMQAQANSVYYGALNDRAMYDKAQAMLKKAGAVTAEKARMYDALQTGGLKSVDMKSAGMEDLPGDLAAQYAGSVLRLTNPTLASALGLEEASEEESAELSLMDEFEPLEASSSALSDDLADDDPHVGQAQDSLGKNPALEKALADAIQKNLGQKNLNLLEDSASFKVNYVAFANPISHLSVSSRFGHRHGRAHLGTDFQAPVGTKIQASASGRVINAGMTGAYGNLIVLDHGNGITTRYAHCSRISVKMGQVVKRGQAIGLVGSTGRSTGPHLHFEITSNGSHLNPQSFLPTPGKRTTRTVVMRRGFKKISEL